MPTYKEISVEDLQLAMVQMLNYFIELKKYNCTSSFYFCILLLYEYCQCSAYFKQCSDESVVNVRITVKHLRDYMSHFGDFNATCNSFMHLRNSIGHLGLKDDLQRLTADLLDDQQFYQILTKCQVPVECITALREYYRHKFRDLSTSEMNF